MEGQKELKGGRRKDKEDKKKWKIEIEKMGKGVERGVKE